MVHKGFGPFILCPLECPVFFLGSGEGLQYGVEPALFFLDFFMGNVLQL
jgi:hypothetical protein